MDWLIEYSHKLGQECYRISRGGLEILEEQLRKTALNLKHIKLDIGSISSNNSINFHQILTISVFYHLYQELGRLHKGVVVLNKVDYTKGINDIVNDKHKVKELKNDLTLNREGRLQRFLRELKKKEKIDKDEYNNVYPSGSQPALIYGLPKIQRTRSPNEIPLFRPIVSSINTYNYCLAKYLCNLLRLHIPNTYTISDTFSFVQELNTIDLSTKCMVFLC